MKPIIIPLIIALLATPVMAQSLPEGTLPNATFSPGVIATSKWDEICGQHLSRNRNVPESEKNQVYMEYEITPMSRKWCDRIAISGKNKGKNAGCEIDHELSLEDGGSNDIKNLWPQPYGGDWNAHMKDKLENRIHKEICARKISDENVKVLQNKLIGDWTKAYKEYYGNR